MFQMRLTESHGAPPSSAHGLAADEKASGYDFHDARRPFLLVKRDACSLHGMAFEDALTFDRLFVRQAIESIRLGTDLFFAGFGPSLCTYPMRSPQTSQVSFPQDPGR